MKLCMNKGVIVKNSFLQNIFSVKNVGCQKVWCILGIKMSFFIIKKQNISYIEDMPFQL